MPTATNQILEANSDKNFVRRILEPDFFPVIENPDGSRSTHRMASNGVILPGDDKPTEIVYPTIVQIDDQLQQLNDDEALQHALSTGEFIPFDDPQVARDFAEDGFKQGRRFFE